MSHDHSHAHHAPTDNEGKLAIAVLLTGGFMVAEIVGGVISGSLALLADAGHMLTDFASLALAWFALRISKKPATWKRSYGYDRFSVLAAFVNGLTLFLIAAWICWEAYERLREPSEVLGGLMFWVAVAGLLVNILAFWVLTRGGHANLNVRAAALHVMGDLLGSVAAIAASVIIMTTGWMAADPILSVVVALIILRSAWHVVKDSAHILLEGAPQNLDRGKIAEALIGTVPGVKSASHIHAWSITEERPMITLEVEVEPAEDKDRVLAAVKCLLRDQFNIAHATVEVYSTRPTSPTSP